ncbi:GNAT family N-acetyltransferase [Hyphobacterium sp. HN65]|uniref:GNAT family N-acetyltransferase n=1 Tax=Hyphobacterium lacteum TaxID=3116575 RepID=A0ABU7LSJ0_9PROT|nr:GNAT family N-acetyltransferase [Hyphobacterium sp. HN65]MEE2526885.1 GNAT family N-acetyltransferase [Hyphobacterium sp. HN65]
MRQRIETERLILRPMDFADASAIHEHCRDGSIARYTARVPHPYPLLAAELYVLTARAAHGKRPGGSWAIARRDDDVLIGACGAFKRKPEDEGIEIGYWTGPSVRGQGIATEAGRALIAAVREDLSPPSITAGHFEDNPASGRVLEKLGFAYTGETRRLFSMGRMDYAVSLDMALAV